MASAGRRRRLTPFGRAGVARFFGVASAVALFLEFWFFVNALNCVSYGEPDVRPAGRPDGRVLGLTHSGGRLRCGVLRVG